MALILEWDTGPTRSVVAALTAAASIGTTVGHIDLTAEHIATTAASNTIHYIHYTFKMILHTHSGQT